jgi:putative phosphoesterase
VEIFCCGDVTNGETLEFLVSHFSGQIRLVSGNMEIYEEAEIKKYKNIIYYRRTARFEAGSYRVGLCHEPFLIEQVLKPGPCDLIFYGHTHKPWIADKDGVKTANPGTLGGVFQKATFAVWETETGRLELKILEEIENL